MKFLIKVLMIGLFISYGFGYAEAQTAQPERGEISININEQFFDAFLETMFKNFTPMEFSVAKAKSDEVKFEKASYSIRSKGEQCTEVIKLERERNGTRTAVRFRDGTMMAPLAFSGSYDIPLVGCVDFVGSAETQIMLDFDREKQAMMARVKVVSINLNNLPGFASGVLSKMMQSTVDKKINPTALLTAEKLSFVFPLESLGGNLKLRATDMRAEVFPGELKVKVFYELSKQ